MEFTKEDIDQLVQGAEPAGKFNPNTLVFSEMAVRVIVLNTFYYALEKSPQQAHPADHKSRGACYLHVGGK